MRIPLQAAKSPNAALSDVLKTRAWFRIKLNDGPFHLP